jgi:hypothetical protein
MDRQTDRHVDSLIKCVRSLNHLSPNLCVVDGWNGGFQSWSSMIYMFNFEHNFIYDKCFTPVTYCCILVPCSLEGGYHYFGGTRHLHLPFKMEDVSSSETLVFPTRLHFSTPEYRR